MILNYIFQPKASGYAWTLCNFHFYPTKIPWPWKFRPPRFSIFNLGWKKRFLIQDNLGFVLDLQLLSMSRFQMWARRLLHNFYQCLLTLQTVTLVTLWFMLYVGLSLKSLWKFQLIQKAAAWAVMGVLQYARLGPALKAALMACLLLGVIQSVH